MTLSATTGGGSGNPVIFSVDPSTSAGICAVSGPDGQTLNSAVGNCIIDANQNGNATYSPAAQVQASIAVAQADSATALSQSDSTITYGNEGAEQLTIAVAPQFSGTPTGTVTIAESGTTLCTITLAAGTGTCTITIPAAKLPAGSDQGTAAYNGARNFASSQSTVQALTVAPASSLAKLALSTATLTYGNEQAEQFTATVSPQFSGTLTGTVAVAESGTTLCTITLSAGTGTCTTSAAKLPPGNYQVTAAYHGDRNFGSSQSAAQVLKVTQASSSTGLAPSLSTVTYGNEQTEQFTALKLSIVAVTYGHENAETLTVHVRPSTPARRLERSPSR